MKNRGFTLIELMVVVAIIGVLAAALLPQVGALRDRARVTRIISTFNTVRISCFAYEGDVGSWPFHNIIDGAFMQLETNPRGVANWHGPYIDRARRRPGDGRIAHIFGGRQMLYDLDNGFGDNHWVNFNGGPRPDRHLILEDIPARVRDGLQLHLDGDRLDGNDGRVAEFWGDWVAITFVEGT